MATVNDKLQGNYIFGLDIGTRSIVGIVGHMDNGVFQVAASSVVEHETRAMIDGQIHDIEKVSATIKSVKKNLEKALGFKLTKVCIAAAGRVLKTTEVQVEQSIEGTKVIDEDMIYSLELLGIEKAHHMINSDLMDEEFGYHCVGYSVTKYFLNDYEINNLSGHKGKKISANVLATFLPNEVVNSLYKAVGAVGLEVYSLTLEPIAAINVAIPENYRLLNIALVDIGAGTSDIAITKDGSIVAYGMIPIAGDEITEKIIQNYLVDFKTGEKIKKISNKTRKTVSFKDIMGISHKITKEEVNETIKETTLELASNIANKIKELNGGSSTNAVFVVGGGGQVSDFTEILANELGINKDRVALRGKEVLKKVVLDSNIKKTPELVTPIGICQTGIAENRHDFIQVFFNDEPLNIFNTNNLTVMDVAAFKGYDPKKLIATKGNDLKYYIDDMEQVIKGGYGQPAKIMINNTEGSFNGRIEMNDYIAIIPAKNGENAKKTLSNLKNELADITLTIDGERFKIKPAIFKDDKEINIQYTIKNRDKLYTVNPTISKVITDLNLDYTNGGIIKNGEISKLTERVQSGDILLLNNIVAEMDAIKNDDTLSLVVNGESIVLKGKSKYVIADVFDYIEFDRTKAYGNIICKINSKEVGFMERLNAFDKVEIYWDKKY